MGLESDTFRYNNIGRGPGATDVTVSSIGGIRGPKNKPLRRKYSVTELIGRCYDIRIRGGYVDPGYLLSFDFFFNFLRPLLRLFFQLFSFFLFFLLPSSVLNY